MPRSNPVTLILTIIIFPRFNREWMAARYTLVLVKIFTYFHLLTFIYCFLIQRQSEFIFFSVCCSLPIMSYQFLFSLEGERKFIFIKFWGIMWETSSDITTKLLFKNGKIFHRLHDFFSFQIIGLQGSKALFQLWLIYSVPSTTVCYLKNESYFLIQRDRTKE